MLRQPEPEHLPDIAEERHQQLADWQRLAGRSCSAMRERFAVPAVILAV
jgi:hypothetical protein